MAGALCSRFSGEVLIVPTTGQPATRRCAECGGVRRWGQVAQNASTSTVYVEATDAPGLRVSEYGYRCDKGHVSDACPRCRSRDTTRYRVNDGASHAIVTCHACDHNSAIALDRALKAARNVRPPL
jgi:uncharacterized Zn finger protein